MLAIEKAIDIVHTNKKDTIKIMTDSSYSINCLTKWYKSWEKKNFKIDGKEVKNLEIIKRVHEKLI